MRTKQREREKERNHDPEKKNSPLIKTKTYRHADFLQMLKKKSERRRNKIIINRKRKGQGNEHGLIFYTNNPQQILACYKQSRWTTKDKLGGGEKNCIERTSIIIRLIVRAFHIHDTTASRRVCFRPVTLFQDRIPVQIATSVTMTAQSAMEVTAAEIKLFIFLRIVLAFVGGIKTASFL